MSERWSIEKYRQYLSEQGKGKSKDAPGFDPARPYAHIRQGWREIGGARIYCRSRHEANYARYLEFLKGQGQVVSWQHEPKTFQFKRRNGTTTYKPDFLVTWSDGRQEWIEVKGYLDKKSKTKIERFKKEYGESEPPLRIVWSRDVKSLGQSLAGLIEGWETN